MTESELIESLTPQQTACVRLWEGRGSGPRIAQQLKLSKKTVENHLAAVRLILSASTSDEAAARYRAHIQRTQEAPRDFLGVVTEAAPAPTLLQPSSPPSWRNQLPFRLEGVTSNDLSVRQRIAWIVFIAIGIALGLSAVANLIRVINDLANR